MLVSGTKGGENLPKRKHPQKEVINRLGEADLVIPASSTTSEAIQCIEVFDQTFSRLPKAYGIPVGTTKIGHKLSRVVGLSTVVANHGLRACKD